MSSNEYDEVRRPAASRSFSLLSSSSPSSDSEGDVPGSVGSGPMLSNLLGAKYNRFLRKPRPENESLVGRKRQERSYYDSDNSYEHRQQPGRASVPRVDGELFDMEANADSSWGRQTLYECLEPEQVESLIAWAHSGKPPTNPLLGTPFAGTGPQRVSEFGGQDDDEVQRNPLLQLVNAPLPLSILNFFADRARNVPEFHYGLYESFDASALVAIGMILEEIITASLLPLAGCHVLRCQQLEAKPSNEETLLAPLSGVSLSHPISKQPIEFDPRNLPEHETAFSAWTLPPEEAMVKMISQGMVPHTGIPLLRDPVRTCGSPVDKEFKVRGNQEVVHHFFSEVSKVLVPDLRKGESKSLLDENEELRDLFLVTKESKRKRTPRVNRGDRVPEQQDQPAVKKSRIFMVEV